MKRSSMSPKLGPANPCCSRPRARLQLLPRGNSLQRSAFALAPTRAYGGAMKSPPRVLTFLSLMALALGTTGARADDSAAECTSNLRILNSVQMQATTDRTVMVVPVKIDNVDKKLLLDTGGLVSQISRATANGLDLPERYREQRLFDLAGNSSNAQATVPKLTLGNQSQNEVPMAVAPNPDLGTALPYDGLLATDLFPGDDIDMDFGARRLTTFSPDHCTGRVVYWPADRVAIVPITENHNLIIIPVMVAGHPLNAVLDTGSQYTVMNMAVANQLFGLNSASPDMTPLTEANGDKSITLYRHLFDKLTFEGVEVSNLQVYLLPNQVAVHDRRARCSFWGRRLFPCPTRVGVHAGRARCSCWGRRIFRWRATVCSTRRTRASRNRGGFPY